MIINSRLFYWHVGSYSTARMTLLCQFSPVNSNFSCQPVRWQNICIRNCVVSMQAKSLPLHKSRTSRILPWTFDLWVGTRRAQRRLWGDLQRWEFFFSDQTHSHPLHTRRRGRKQSCSSWDPKSLYKNCWNEISPEPRESLGEIDVVKQIDSGSKVFLGPKVHPNLCFREIQYGKWKGERH